MLLLRQCWWVISIQFVGAYFFLQFSNWLNNFSTGCTMFTIKGITILTSIIRGSFGCIMHTTNHVESMQLLCGLCPVITRIRCRLIWIVMLMTFMLLEFLLDVYLPPFPRPWPPRPVPLPDDSP